jgi:hypothetical protein
MKNKSIKQRLTVLTAVVTVMLLTGFVLIPGTQNNPRTPVPDEVTGYVLYAGGPFTDASLVMYAAGTGSPTKVAEGRTGKKGEFKLKVTPSKDAAAYYIIAKNDKNVALALLLKADFPGQVTINELTTIASAFTAARFINGEEISGNTLGLKIAAGNVPNLVDPVTGGWGKVLLDPINSTQTTTLANLNTLGNLLYAYGSVATEDWKTRFMQAGTPVGGKTPKNTFEVIAGIARAPWQNPQALFGLFNEVYPQPVDGSRRKAPFVPYLAYVPDDFTLSLCFAGGGMFANGRFMFDAEGNLWSGQNWMPGSQSGVVNSIGGGVLKMAPDGTPLSPPITGFTGMGLDGVGWGTAVTNENVWATSFNGKILVMDFNGKPIGDESIFPFKEKFLGLMGIGVAANGDVWIADGSNNQLLFFPGGRPKDGRIVKVDGLSSPFDIVIDPKNYVWVSNSQSDKLVRFPANDPTKVETYTCGLSVRALALDSKGNVWAVSNMSLDFPVPKVPEGASIMEQFEILGDAMLKYPKSTGVAHLILADGTMAEQAGFTGGGQIDVPWGVNIDGNDDVWIGNLGPRTRSVVLMAGYNTKGHPAGTKAGDVIHTFKSGSIQMLTDVAIDPAGNVWAANNWNDPLAATSADPQRSTSTWGGGSGLTVIYGVAEPVRPPRMGVVRKY